MLVLEAMAPTRRGLISNEVESLDYVGPNLPPYEAEETIGEADSLQLSASSYLARVYLDRERSSLGGFMWEPRMVKDTSAT